MSPDYAHIVHSYAGVKVLVVGDAMLDVYHFGRVDRLSPEAPVPVYVEDYTKNEVRRGGADHVAHQLEAWGCRVETVFPERRSVKHRYMVGHYQVFRRDSDSTEEVDYRQLPEGIEPQVVVISDYGKGFLTARFLELLILEGRARNIPIVVDPKGRDWSKYAGATVICPNEKELVDPSFPRIVLKRGEKGIRLIEGSKATDIPAHVVPVFDVTGAGDAVVAAIAATLGVGEGLEIACHIACAAASIGVQKVGTSICSTEELLSALPTGVSISSTMVTKTSSSTVVNGVTLSSLPSIPTGV